MVMCMDAEECVYLTSLALCSERHVLAREPLDTKSRMFIGTKIVLTCTFIYNYSFLRLCIVECASDISLSGSAVCCNFTSGKRS